MSFVREDNGARWGILKEPCPAFYMMYPPVEEDPPYTLNVGPVRVVSVIVPSFDWKWGRYVSGER